MLHATTLISNTIKRITNILAKDKANNNDQKGYLTSFYVDHNIPRKPQVIKEICCSGNSNEEVYLDKGQIKTK
jgi:hypothetical protein